MSMQSAVLDVGGSQKRVVVINHKDEVVTEVTTVDVDKVHHILLLDRSGSMSSEINRLIDNVVSVAKAIPDGDLISVVWFSSNDDYRTIIKGATYSDALIPLLDSIRSTRGCTCFSDPIKEVGLIIEETKPLCPNISVTLFTDGRPVVPWTTAQEIEKITYHLGLINPHVLAFNTIGYGNWYNRELLVDMASGSQFGTFCHSSDIDEYMHIFEDNYQTICEVVKESVEVISTNAKIIYLNRKFTKMEIGSIEMTRLDKRKNQFIIIGNSDEDFSFSYQGESYQAADITTPIGKATVTNLLYALAYNSYYQGNRQLCLDILAKSLGDKHLVDTQMGAFTYDETGLFSNNLKYCVFNNDGRLIDGSCSPDYIPADDAFCVMDLLGILQNTDSYYVPFSKNVASYTRIGRKVVDEFDIFKKSEKEVFAPFGDFIYNKKSMNLSINYYIPGVVTLNPKIAKDAMLPTEIPSGIFRTHTIIKDGSLNLKEIECLVTTETLRMIESLYDDCIAIIPNDNPVYLTDAPDATLYNRVLICLDTLPIINRGYINKAADINEIFTVVSSLNALEAKQKVTGFFLDLVYAKHPVAKKEGALKNYTLAQLKVLENHGLDKNLNYKGVSNVKPKAEASDSYETRTMEFYMAGCSSWPKVSEMLERVANKKKLTPAMTIMEAQMRVLEGELKAQGLDLDTPSVKLRDALNTIKSETKNRISIGRCFLNSLKMAKLLTGDWFDGLVSNDAGDYLYEKDGVTMVARVARTIEYF